MPYQFPRSNLDRLKRNRSGSLDRLHVVKAHGELVRPDLVAFAVVLAVYRLAADAAWNTEAHGFFRKFVWALTC